MGHHVAFIHHLLTTTVPPEHGQESLSHEPWEAVSLAIIGVIGSTIAAFFGYLGHVRAREAKETAEQVHETVKTTFESTVGTPNGHGNIMEQLARLSDNQMRDSNALNEFQMHADRKLERLDAKLEGHVQESVIYRAGVNNSLGALADRLRAHDEWERENKYRVEQGMEPLPWDGVDRRRTTTVKRPPKQERREPPNKEEQ